MSGMRENPYQSPMTEPVAPPRKERYVLDVIVVLVVSAVLGALFVTTRSNPHVRVNVVETEAVEAANAP